MQHRPHPRADRLETSQPQRVEFCISQASQCTSAIAPVAVGSLGGPDVPDPVTALNAPAVAHQLQQGLWGAAQASERQVGGLNRPAVNGAGSGQFHKPAGANPVLANVLRCLPCPQCPGNFPTVAILMNRCLERDAAISLEVALDQAVKCLLVSIHRLQKVGPLGAGHT